MTYLTDVVSKLKSLAFEHSEKLAFVDQPWVQVQGDGEATRTYYFKNSGELIVIELDGNTHVGRWEMLANIDAIIIHYLDFHLTLKRSFMDRAIMVFFKGEEPFLFVNENKIDEASNTVRGYLDKYIEGVFVDSGSSDPPDSEDSTSGLLWFWGFSIPLICLLLFAILKELIS